MSVQTWVTLLNAFEESGAASGTVLENSSTQTAISPGRLEQGQMCLIPANYLKVGTILRITATGIISTKATEAALTMGVSLIKPGETEANKGKALLEGKFKYKAEAKKSATWKWESTHRVSKVGKAGKTLSQGALMGVTGVLPAETATGVANVSLIPTESSTGGESAGELETGLEKGVILWATWSEISTENKITCYQWLVEALS